MEIQQRLSDVLSEFARTLLTDFPIQSILDRLVERIVDVLPVTSAGVTLISPGVHPRLVAASDESALRFEHLQTELGEGPCVVAFETGAAVAVPDFRTDGRFSRFSARALEEGLVAVFTFPLKHRDRQLGALDLYRSTSGPLDVEAAEAASTLADVASAYLVNAQAWADLQHASDSARATALHDPLTGLPNRTLLIQRLEHSIQRCRRSRKIAAVLYADLDRFKAVNDAYGHHVGDEMLIAVALRLSSLLRPGDTLARMSGDEFVILCEDLDDPIQVEPIASRLDDALGTAFIVSGIEIIVSASVGISFAGRDREDSEQILQDADAAMYQAKLKGGGRHGVVDPRERQIADHRAKLSRELRGALSRGEMSTAYQPIVSTADGGITSVETLLRWMHPIDGLVEATTTVQLAEMTGLIGGIGAWVLERACLDQKLWPVGRHRLLAVSVNVSAHQLMAPDFVAIVAAVLAKAGTRPECVTLEITESVFIQDSARALVVLRELKQLGLSLALDDFGTGYSSLGYLKRFPVDIVKLDQIFIADVDREPTSGSIVRALVGLAHDLGMTVVAEGVETAQQYERVVSLGCDAYQGYFFAHPMPAQELGQLMNDIRRSPTHLHRIARPWQFLTGGPRRRAG